MPEQELNSAAAKFISSLVKSLQILCNGQVEFNESIELVGHINVRVDRKYKFDYIVDEQVSKEGEDSSTTFLSNSYHSCPPLKQSIKKTTPSQIDQDVMFSELPQSIPRRLRQTTTESQAQSHDFHSEDTSVGGNGSNPNYSVTVGSPPGEENQGNQMVVKLEGGDDSNDCMVLPASPGDYEHVGEGSGGNFPVPGSSTSFEESESNQTQIFGRKRRKPNDQGDLAIKDTEPTHGTGCARSGGKQRLMTKMSAAFSCKEYLDRYNNVYTRQKHPNKKEMIKVFSELSQKFGVAITIKPAKYVASSVFGVENNVGPLTSSFTTQTYMYSDKNQTDLSLLSTSEPSSEYLSVTSKIAGVDKAAFHATSGHVLNAPSAFNLPSGSQILTVVATDTKSVTDNHSVVYPQDCHTVLQVTDYTAKQGTSDGEALIPFSTPDSVSISDAQASQKIFISDPSSSHSLLGSGQGEQSQCLFTPSKMITRSAKKKFNADYMEPDTPSSALLNAIAVALAKEVTLSPTSSTPEFLRQQPMPKRNRESYLVRLRKEDPERYEQYKCLSKEEQARERRRISEANQHPEAFEKNSLMKRVLYLRKVGKLPSGLRDKTNDEIRQIPTSELRKLLPPTKSLKHMDPATKEEWYRLGRSREWRRKKKLLDPEGFKRYNNERAKKYQDKLRKSNPEKFKELRAKAADRLRHYRFSQRIMKAIKEGKEIKISDSSLTGANTGGQKRLRGRKRAEEIVELRDAEELLIEENIDKAHYMIPECAATHGEAATSRESSSTQAGQSVQSDILELMYNY